MPKTHALPPPVAVMTSCTFSRSPVWVDLLRTPGSPDITTVLNTSNELPAMAIAAFPRESISAVFDSLT